MTLMLNVAIATPALQCHRMTLVSTNVPATDTINLLIATQLAHIGGVHPSSLQSAAIAQRHCSTALGKVGHLDTDMHHDHM